MNLKLKSFNDTLITYHYWCNYRGELCVLPILELPLFKDHSLSVEFIPNWWFAL